MGSPAGLLNLLNSGLQDTRLSDSLLDAKKTEAEKTGRFTTELYKVDFDNRPLFGGSAKATIPRRGHLLARAYLSVQMPDIRTIQKGARDWCLANNKIFAGPTFGWTNSIGHVLLSNAQLTIGGNPIDTIEGRLMEMMDEFNTPLEKVPIINKMIGRHDTGFSPTSNGWSESNTNQEILVPLPFWFSRDPTTALPIDAIGSDPIQINISFNTIPNLYVSSDLTSTMPGSFFYYKDADSEFLPKKTVIPGFQMPSVTGTTYPFTCSLLLEYVYIDRPEASRFRLVDLSYPIIQHYSIIPFTTKEGTPEARIQMRIPNPTREIMFMVHRTDADQFNAPFLATRDLDRLWPDAKFSTTNPIPAYSSDFSEPIQSLSLIYEGNLVRYSTSNPSLFRRVLPAIQKTKAKSPWHHKYIYSIPFSVKGEGEANLDKIQSVELSLKFRPFNGSTKPSDVPSYTVFIYAETQNILRIYGGRAGLLFTY